MILLASDGSQESRNYENLITQIARREKENLQFNWQPAVINAEDYLEQIQIYTDKTPAVIILDFSQEPYPYYKVNSSHLQSVSKLENLLQEIQNGNIELQQPNENDYLKVAQRISDYLFSPLFYQKHQSFAILLYSSIALLAFSLIHCLCGFCFKKKNIFEEKKQKEDKKVEEEKNLKKQEKKQEEPQKKKEEKKEVKNEKKVEEVKEQNKQGTQKQSKQKSKKKSKKE